MEPIDENSSPADSSPPVAGPVSRSGRRGLIPFLVIWFGQTVSVFGSQLAGFALGVWVFQTTGSATQFAIISTLSILPGIVLMPFAGALVDRWDRRTAMLVADAVAGLSALVLGVFFYLQMADVWTIGATLAVSSTCHAVRWPALSASVPLLVPKKHLGRAAGLQQTGYAGSQILAPLLGAALLGIVGVWGIVMINCGSFFVAVASLVPIRIPRPTADSGATEAGRTLRQDITFGWHYLRQRRGLMGLLLLLAGSNFSLGMAQVLLTPLVLSFGTPQELSYVLFSAGIGMLAGGLLMGVWGGPRRRIAAILVCLSVEATLLIGVGILPSIPIIAVSVLLIMGSVQIGQACSQTIWQTKVAPEVQGRVFSMRSMIATASQPIAYMAAGPLADYVFEPLLLPGGALSGSLGQILGVGPGRGMGLIFVALGVLTILWVGVGLRSRRLRNLEEDLPDAIDSLTTRDLPRRHANERQPVTAP